VVWRRRSAAVGLAALACGGLVPVRTARANDLRHALRTSPSLLGLGIAVTPAYQNAADVILEQAARNLPIPSMSAGFTYRLDGDTYERTSPSFAAPFFTERAETVGEKVVSVDLAFQWLRFDEYDGEKLGRDLLPVSVSQAAIRLSATPELGYTLATLNVTYGLTDDLDLNASGPTPSSSPSPRPSGARCDAP
jgi:hypothetical protein